MIFSSSNKKLSMMKRVLVMPCVLLLVFSGCSPNTYNSLVNYKSEGGTTPNQHVITNYTPIELQTGDILNIEVSSTEAEAVAIFKEYQTTGYLLDSEGAIDFPLSGKVVLAGKNLEGAKRTLLNSLEKYFDIQPTINLSLANFSVTVNGEVKSPKIIPVKNDRINIIEAIVSSGDFTSYSKRDSVMVMRETAGKRTFGYVNFNSSEMFESPFFYLRQNDLIYVKPEKRFLGTVKTRQDKLLPYISVGISVILLSLTISNNR